MFFKPDEYFHRRAAGGASRRGGPILLNMIHEVHNLRMLCGDIVAVQAIASHAVRGFPVEDTVTINLRFANGALGLVPAVRHRGVRAELGADVAGEQGVSDLPGRGLLRRDRHVWARSRCRRCG